MNASTINKDHEEEVKELRYQLQEALDTIEAIRTGQIDALMVETVNGHELFTLNTADQGYRVFIENMSEGAITLNQAGIILYANSTFAGLVSVPLQNVIGHPFIDFVCEKKKADFLQIFNRSWAGNHREESVLVKGGNEIPVQLSVTSIEVEGTISLCILVTDLTQQKKNEQELISKNDELRNINEALFASNNDLAQFASVASHDLQEPVRKILVFANLVHTLESGNITAEALRYLNKIISSTQRMKMLILDLLNYSRLAQADKSFIRANLSSVVREVVTDLELQIEEKKARIIVGDLPDVEINVSQMRQVFYNLINNSLKFARKEVAPEIVIQQHKMINGSTSHNARVSIMVSDNGIGFDNKHAGTIFTLFERLNSKDTYEGSGIGLSITRKIIEKHQGTITAKSNEGEGAVFLITLPINQT